MKTDTIFSRIGIPEWIFLGVILFFLILVSLVYHPSFPSLAPCGAGSCQTGLPTNATIFVKTGPVFQETYQETAPIITELPKGIILTNNTDPVCSGPNEQYCIKGEGEAIYYSTTGSAGIWTLDTTGVDNWLRGPIQALACGYDPNYQGGESG